MIIVLYTTTWAELLVGAPPECERWFKESGAKPGAGRDCVWKCVAHRISMGTFTCGSYCDDLCGREVIYKPKPLPVCPIEGWLAVTSPKEALKVNESADRAILRAAKHFGANRSDDESDAFRHFVWSALNTQAIGFKLAEKFLEAHESCVTEEAGQEMDRVNNTRGIEFVKAHPKISEDEIVQEAIKRIRERKLVVIRPRRAP